MCGTKVKKQFFLTVLHEVNQSTPSILHLHGLWHFIAIPIHWMTVFVICRVLFYLSLNWYYFLVHVNIFHNTRLSLRSVNRAIYLRRMFRFFAADNLYKYRDAFTIKDVALLYSHYLDYINTLLPETVYYALWGIDRELCRFLRINVNFKRIKITFLAGS